MNAFDLKQLEGQASVDNIETTDIIRQAEIDYNKLSNGKRVMVNMYLDSHCSFSRYLAIRDKLLEQLHTKKRCRHTCDDYHIHDNHDKHDCSLMRVTAVLRQGDDVYQLYQIRMHDIMMQLGPGYSRLADVCIYNWQLNFLADKKRTDTQFTEVDYLLSADSSELTEADFATIHRYCDSFANFLCVVRGFLHGTDTDGSNHDLIALIKDTVLKLRVDDLN